MKKISNSRYEIDDIFLKNEKKFRLCYSRFVSKQSRHYSRFFAFRISNAKIFYPDFLDIKNYFYFSSNIGKTNFKYNW